MDKDSLFLEVFVRRIRTGIIAATLLCVLTLAACHGGGGMVKMRFVSQADSARVMEFTVRDLSILDRVHMAIVQHPLKGQYVVRNADAIVEEGSLSQEPPGYVLKSKDGKQQRLEVQKTDSLKAEDGTIWNPQKPTSTAVNLRKW
jgi:hypothetical protein